MNDTPDIDRYNERLAIIEDFIERVGIKVFDGEVPEYEAVRDKYMEIKRIFGAVPEVVRLEWKRVYEEEIKKHDKQG